MERPHSFSAWLVSPESFAAFAEDKGAIGQILRGFSKNVMSPYSGNELLREAVRCESSGGDPWQLLLDMGVRIARQDADVFRAAQSQRKAWRRLLDDAHGWGNLRERNEQLRNVPPGTPIQPFQRQLFSRRWRVNRWAMLDDPKLDKDLLPELERMGREEDAKLKKRYGRAALGRPPARRRLDENKVDYMLARYWVRFGDGGPGFMFFSTNATTQFIYEMLGWPHWGANVENVKKSRRRLGLLLAAEENPYITSVKFQHAQRRITGEGRRRFKYTGVVFLFGQQCFPRRPRAR